MNSALNVVTTHRKCPIDLNTAELQDQDPAEICKGGTVVGSLYTHLKDTLPSGVLSFNELCSWAAKPGTTSKIDTPAIVPSAAPVKTKDDILTHNNMTCCWIDIDHDGKPLVETVERVKALGVTAVVHSTASAHRMKSGVLQGDRWRVIIPISRPMGCEEWLSTQTALARLLGGGEEACRVQQPIFLPTNPDNGFYAYEIIDAAQLDPDNLPVSLQATIDAMAAETRQEEIARSAPVARRGRVEGDSIIDKANAAYRLEDVLRSAGYKECGRRWLHPNSTSGIPGVIVLSDGFYFSHHSQSTDPLADGHRHDAFDLLLHLQYGGDQRRAIKELADELDPEGQKARVAEWKEQQSAAAATILTATPVAEEWSVPIPLTSQDLPEITIGVLPGIYREFAAQVSSFAQTPSALAVFQCLGILAAVLQKRFVVSPFAGYIEPLALWLLLFLDPGTRKTAVQGHFKAPLVEWELGEVKRLQADRKRVLHECEMVDEQIRSIKQRAGRPDFDAASASAEIMCLEISKPDLINIPRLLADDVTTETLQNIMAANGERMAVISDEGGVFEVVSGLYSKGGGSNINIFLQAHAGSPCRVDRQGRSVAMASPALTLSLSIQPSILKQLGAKAGWRGNGFLARNLYAIPTSTVGSRDVRKNAPINPATAEAYRAAVLRLIDIPALVNDCGHDTPRVLGLTKDALEAWYDFAAWIEARQGVGREFHHIQDWTSKLPGAVLRVAGVVHVAEMGPGAGSIERDTIDRSVSFARTLIPHAQAAFGMMGADPAVEGAEKILDWLKQQVPCDAIKQNEIARALHGQFATVKDLQPGLEVLVERNYLRGPLKEPTGGRPSIIYEVNPAVWGASST